MPVWLQLVISGVVVRAVPTLPLLNVPSMEVECRLARIRFSAFRSTRHPTLAPFPLPKQPVKNLFRQQLEAPLPEIIVMDPFVLRMSALDGVWPMKIIPTLLVVLTYRRVAVVLIRPTSIVLLFVPPVDLTNRSTPLALPRVLREVSAMLSLLVVDPELVLNASRNLLCSDTTSATSQLLFDVPLLFRVPLPELESLL